LDAESESLLQRRNQCVLNWTVSRFSRSFNALYRLDHKGQGAMLVRMLRLQVALKKKGNDGQVELPPPALADVRPCGASLLCCLQILLAGILCCKR